MEFKNFQICASIKPGTLIIISDKWLEGKGFDIFKISSSYG